MKCSHRVFDNRCLCCATPRNREPWTPAEERRLVTLYAKPKSVMWCGIGPHTAPMYYAATVLQRTPCACQNRMAEIRRGAARQGLNP